MLPSRIVQPLVCCVGNPVAGNPTQFVMMRAARLIGIEWRFLTSEVAIDKFEVAVRGIQALGFDGISLMPPFQQAIIPLLESVTGSALALGSVNVARADGNSWLGDNTLGSGLASCLEAHAAASGSRDTASISLATDPTRPDDSTDDGIALVHAAPSVAMSLKLASWKWSRSVIESTDQTEFLTIDSNSNQQLPDQAKADRPVRFLVLERTPTQQHHRQLASLNWGEHPACVVIDQGEDRVSRSFRDLMIKNDVQWIDSVVLRAHRYAADFQFWTGMQPPIELIQDSLEEYYEW